MEPWRGRWSQLPPRSDKSSRKLLLRRNAWEWETWRRRKTLRKRRFEHNNCSCEMKPEPPPYLRLLRIPRLKSLRHLLRISPLYLLRHLLLIPPLNFLRHLLRISPPHFLRLFYVVQKIQPRRPLLELPTPSSRPHIIPQNRPHITPLIHPQTLGHPPIFPPIPWKSLNPHKTSLEQTNEVLSSLYDSSVNHRCFVQSTSKSSFIRLNVINTNLSTTSSCMERFVRFCERLGLG